MITGQELLELADNMAGAASEMGMMGYESLLNARKTLIYKLQELFINEKLI